MLEQEPRRECWKLEELALEAAAWGTMVRVEPERRSARARKAEVLQRQAWAPVRVRLKKVAKAQELLAERWRPEQAFGPKLRAKMRTLSALQSRKRKPEPTLMEVPPEQPGHWLRTLKLLAQAR